MEHEVQQSTSESQMQNPQVDPNTVVPKREEPLKKPIPASPIPSQIEIWNRIRYGHVATAMRVRSLLLFISSTLITFIETISEPKPIKIPPTEIITRIVSSFISGSVEQSQNLSHETFLDILLEKIPNSDVKGMHYHEVYLAISPMISRVNWARIKFDRRDAMRCYNSLSNILQVCFQQVGLANRGEADQLLLAIYVSSVWCSILKQHPELSNPFSEQQDFESYMKTWVFDGQFENFSKVFVASCCQIMESSDHIKRRYSSIDVKSPLDSEGMEIHQPLSLTASHPVSEVSSPSLPPISTFHSTWGRPAPIDHNMPMYMHPGPAHFVPYPQMMHPPIDPYQNFHIEHIPPTPIIKTPKPTKRKQQKPPTMQDTMDSETGKTRKKGPKPERGGNDSGIGGESSRIESTR
uniref:RB_A domain-containing protein n=1 Tax=Caenorhabditis tropicalis TaxID=1561998 RepID=A0A1I7UVP3_9PELO